MINLCFIMLESEGVSRMEEQGEHTCSEGGVAYLQSLLRQQQVGWRVKCWHKNVGRLLYAEDHPLAQALQCGVLCRIFPFQEEARGFLFLAFDQPLLSPSVLRSVATIITEKLRDSMMELMTRERTAVELQNIVNHYRILFDRAPVLMNSFNKHNRCTLWNGECEHVFGWTLEELNQLPDPLALFYPDPDIRLRVRESVNHSPTLEMHEWYPCRRDGTVLGTLWSNITLPEGDILNIGVDITERKRMETLLALKATTDALTHCYNHLAILEHLQQSLEQCEELSRFGRLGGEEFLLLLPVGDTSQAIALTNQIRAQLQCQPFLLGEISIPLSFSAGVLAVSHNHRELTGGFFPSTCYSLLGLT